MLYEFELFQDDECVAAGGGIDPTMVYREGQNYKTAYSQDGPVRLVFYTKQELSESSMAKVAQATVNGGD